jgi:O-antigen/teichoic acid export membrane protein
VFLKQYIINIARNRDTGTAAANAALRFSGLGMRLVLSLFMARFMSFEDIGVFALMTGLTGLLPSVAGLGLNFFLSRELVGMDHHAAIMLVRDRLRVSLIAAAFCASVVALVLHFGLADLPLPSWMAVAIITMELLGFDIQMALIARSRSTLANASLMFRTGIWIGPYVVAAFAVPSLRTMEAVGYFWLGGLVLSHFVVAIQYRADFTQIIGLQTPSRSYLGTVGWRAAKIYASDLGLAGSAYLDRFLITGLAGIRAAGILNRAGSAGGVWL